MDVSNTCDEIVKVTQSGLEVVQLVDSDTVRLDDSDTVRPDDSDTVRLDDSDTVNSSLVIDIDGEDTANGDNNSTHDDTVQLVESVPSYNSDFTGFLTDKEFCMETGKHLKNDTHRKLTCFNCLGDHNLNVCPEPHNQINIRKNRASFLGNRVSSSRYHQDAENKYGQLQPGRISVGLKHALGLNSDQAPHFLYKMRYLGYPRGWLKQAEVERAPVALFDGDGKAHLHPDEEEGEMDTPLIRYNPERLVEFPGFNVPFDGHTKEESYILRMPPMDPRHRKSEFERYMKEFIATKYKKKKLEPSQVPSHSIPPPPPSDMEVDERLHSTPSNIEVNLSADLANIPPLPPPLPLQPSPPSEPKEDGELSDEDLNPKIKEINSPSTLENSASNIITGDPQPNLDNSVEIIEENNKGRNPAVKRKSLPTTEENSDSQSSNSSNSNISNSNKKQRHHKSNSKGFSLGVFIPESVTPFGSLPDPTKWSVEISDHINFENLPDALGTWSKMKNLVSKVKKKMTVLHSEDD